MAIASMDGRFCSPTGTRPDNWLFSLILPEFPVFALMRPSLLLLVMSGWFIFLGCVAMTLAVARRVAGRWAAVGLAPVLLLSNQAALGNVGSYSQPVSHNISVFWGLVATYAGMQWLARRCKAGLLLAVAALFVAAVSDPWTNAAFSLPIVLVALALTLLPGPGADRLAALALAVGAGVAAVLAATRAFGLLGFLPKTPMALARRQDDPAAYPDARRGAGRFVRPAAGLSPDERCGHAGAGRGDRDLRGAGGGGHRPARRVAAALPGPADRGALRRGRGRRVDGRHHQRLLRGRLSPPGFGPGGSS